MHSYLNMCTESIFVSAFVDTKLLQTHFIWCFLLSGIFTKTKQSSKWTHFLVHANTFSAWTQINKLLDNASVHIEYYLCVHLNYANGKPDTGLRISKCVVGQRQSSTKYICILYTIHVQHMHSTLIRLVNQFKY